MNGRQHSPAGEVQQFQNLRPCLPAFRHELYGLKTISGLRGKEKPLARELPTTNGSAISCRPSCPGLIRVQPPFRCFPAIV